MSLSLLGTDFRTQPSLRPVIPRCCLAPDSTLYGAVSHRIFGMLHTKQNSHGAPLCVRSIFAQSPRTTTKIAEALDTGTQMARAISEVITLVHIVTAIVAKGSGKIDASQICRGATRLKALEPELPMNVPRCAVGLIEHRCHVDCSKVELDTPPIGW